MHLFSRVDLDDTDSQNDWTANNTPTDGALNDTDVLLGEGALVLSSADSDGFAGAEGGIFFVGIDGCVLAVVSTQDVQAATGSDEVRPSDNGTALGPYGPSFIAPLVATSLLLQERGGPGGHR